MVHFVGAGPGAKDLITVRGAALLAGADMIIYTGSLINKELLEYAGENCRMYDSAYLDLDEVAGLYRDNRDLDIVRLHTGDPSIYGAIKEQMDILDKEGIEYEVCPGVSSMAGAAASLKTELTLPGVSQSIIISRTGGRTKVPPCQELSALSAHGSTMVLFLSAGLAYKVRDELTAGGYDEDTPAAVVYKATWDDEKILRTTLGKLPEEMDAQGINKTALIIVGNVLDGEYELSKLYDKDFDTGFRTGTGRQSTDS
ncbi:MAG: precorrin-4 C(11)-methyltransferase [Lachnospiraceae bacterium]|nr:precorrin-4 C(11)-methyltransferase [Lachnospiraceae bacterium]